MVSQRQMYADSESFATAEIRGIALLPNEITQSMSKPENTMLATANSSVPNHTAACKGLTTSGAVGFGLAARVDCL